MGTGSGHHIEIYVIPMGPNQYVVRTDGPLICAVLATYRWDLFENENPGPPACKMVSCPKAVDASAHHNVLEIRITHTCWIYQKSHNLRHSLAVNYIGH